MRELADIFQGVVMTCGVGFLVAIGVSSFAIALVRFLSRPMRRMWRHGRVGALLAAGLVLCAVFYGGSKHIRFDTGLTDNGSMIANGTVHVAWRYSGIPSGSSLYIDYRLEGSTNEWENLAETTVAALEWNGTLADATNYEYYVYTTYVPPTPVHTNGVWQGQVYETKGHRGANAFILLGGKLKEHGATIAPPRAKRKDDEDE